MAAVRTAGESFARLFPGFFDADLSVLSGTSRPFTQKQSCTNIVTIVAVGQHRDWVVAFYERSPPSRRIMSAKPGKLVAMKVASSTFTGRSEASPITRADIAMR